MKYACIGERLKHSFSKEIHNALADYEYEIKEIPKDELGDFICRADFLGINVTIPYKEAVIPYLYEIDDAAKAIGAVNTVVKKDGKLFGYNTDFYGMSKLFFHANVSVFGKKAAILGSGGTAKTAKAVLSSLGASEILTVSRSGKDGAVSYSELYEKHADVELIVNTTPVGMFPDTESSPVELNRFKNLCGVIDAVYNPLRTKLVSDAKEMGISAEGGLYMLVAQAVKASELFLGKEYSEGEIEKVFKLIKASKENLVLIGMPSSGKTTLAKELSTLLSKDYFDSDAEIVRRHGEITEIFNSKGEKAFRDIESEIIKELSSKTGVIIATGGGAVLREENVKLLKKNGITVFLDRALESLTPTKDRPLSSDFSALEKIYRERYPIYEASAELKIKVDTTPCELAKKIKEILFL